MGIGTDNIKSVLGCPRMFESFELCYKCISVFIREGIHVNNLS